MLKISWNIKLFRSKSASMTKSESFERFVRSATQWNLTHTYFYSAPIVAVTARDQKVTFIKFYELSLLISEGSQRESSFHLMLILRFIRYAVFESFAVKRAVVRLTAIILFNL